MSNNNWLFFELKKTNAKLDYEYEPLINVEVDGEKVGIYTPTSDEYRVTADVVQKAADLGAKIIAYSKLWCGATYEGEEHGKLVGVKVMPYGALFAYLKRKGIS